MKVAIVNDMRMAREILRRVVDTVPDVTVAWTATDGAEATRLIMQATPCAILVVTATVEGNFSKVYEAMSHGALDAVNTAVMGMDGGVEVAADFKKKLEPIRSLITGSLIGQFDPPEDVPRKPPGIGNPLLMIGASTGGPQAVADLLGALTSDFPAPVVVVQHVDEQFAEGLASWLNDRTALEVCIARNGSTLQAGTVLIAGTNGHFIVNANHTVGYIPFPQEMPYRPSVDVAFRSVAKHWSGSGCALLLTGMGRDGAEGMLALRKCGFLTIAQDQASCVVDGMPKAADELDACDAILPVPSMAERIQQHFASLAVC